MADLSLTDIVANSSLSSSVVNGIFAEIEDWLDGTTNNSDITLKNGNLRTGTADTNTLKLQAYDVDGTAYIDFITLTAGNTPTCVLSGDITTTTQSQGDNSTKIATTAYVDAAVLAEDFWTRTSTTITMKNAGDTLKMNTTEKIEFRDAAIYLNSSADGILDIVSDTSVDITTTTINVSGTIDFGTNTITDGTLAGDWDFGTGDLTTGAKFIIDVDGSAGADGQILLGAGGDAQIFFDGTDFIILTDGAGASGIILDSEDDTVEIKGSGTLQATFDTSGLNLVSGDAYYIDSTSVLNATTLGSGVTASSLTSVGTLTSLALSGDITITDAVNDGNPQVILQAGGAEGVKFQAVYDSGAQTLDYVQFESYAAAATADKGEFRFLVDGTEITQVNDSGINLVSGLAYYINDISVLNATTLGSGVTASSLTSVGTLTSLALSGDITITDAVNDGNPRLEIQASGTEGFKIQAVYDLGAQTLDYVQLESYAASATADKGEFRFIVDGTEIGQVNDSGVNIVSGLAYYINDTSVLNGTTLGSGVTASSLTSVGTLVSLNVTGAVGVGTASPEATGIHIFESDASVAPNADADALVIERNGTVGMSFLSGTTSNCFIMFGDSGDDDIGSIQYSHNTNTLSLTTNTTTWWTLDSSGLMAVGPNSGTTASYEAARLRTNNGTRTNGDDVFLSFYMTDSGGISRQTGKIESVATDVTGNMNSSQMLFYTRTSASTTLTLSLYQDQVGIGLDSPAYPLHVLKSYANFTGYFDNSHGSLAEGIVIKFSGYAPDDNTKRFLFCGDSSTTRLLIYSDGDVVNHDGSYGTISDRRLKQQITDTGSKLKDLLKVKIRNYKFNSDVEAYGEDAEKRIGVIAQELEEVFPSLVKDNGNNHELAVKQSIFIPILIKSLQEAYTEFDRRLKAVEA